MSQALDDLYAEKHSIVREMFIATADDNYIAARWCYLEELNVDFFWLAVHSVEKYLKAALLLNGQSARSYNHDIVRLYADVKRLAPELLPERLMNRADLASGQWLVETAEKFVARLYSNGLAENRYLVFGFAKQPEDLLKLDELVFRVQRLCQPLEAHFSGRNIARAPDKPMREWLKEHPTTASDLHANLEKILQGERGKTLQGVSVKWNYLFAPKNMAQPGPIYMTASASSVLARRVIDDLKEGPQTYSRNDRLWEWVKSNIELSKDARKEIDKQRTELKAKGPRRT
jgi:HEPN domain-containing protein